MNLQITRQTEYSRGDLLLRTFFGWAYIGIPHMFLLCIYSIGLSIANILTFWIILFTGVYPKNFFDFTVQYYKWYLRLTATLYNLVDGYPALGLNGDSDKVKFEVTYPESVGRGTLLVRYIFGPLMCIPHLIALEFRMIATAVIAGISFWIILFTGNFPEGMHAFQVGTLRWMMRITTYLGVMHNDYPPFSGKE